MLILCDKTTSRGEKIEYYFKSKTQQICVVKWSESEIEKSRTKIFVGTSFSGVSVTLLEILFRDTKVTVDLISLSGLLLIICLLACYASRKYDGYLEKRGDIQCSDIEELNSLFRAGVVRRIRQFFFFCFFLILTCCLCFDVLETQDPFWFVIFIGGILVTLMILVMISPIQYVQFKLYLRRCKKECQKK